MEGQKIEWKNMEYPFDFLLHQIWCPHTSTETRLVLSDRNQHPKSIINREYEEYLLGFNLGMRRTEYTKCTNKYCKCYDCWTEEGIIKRFLGKKEKQTMEDGESFVDSVKNFISESLRTSATSTKFPEFHNYERKNYTDEKFIDFISDVIS